MANNISVNDSSSSPQVVKTTDNAGVHTPHHNVDTCTTVSTVSSVTAVTTVSTVTSLTQMNGQAIAMGTGVRSAGTQRVTIATDDVVPASQSGTWNITNISGTISLPTGAASETTLSALNTKVGTSGALADNTANPTVGGLAGFTMVFDGSTWDRWQGGVTISAALPAGSNAIGKLAANSGVDIGDVDVTSCALPTGASTAAKQPALGTAGTASADVITVQGITSMTPLLVTASAGTNLNTSALALETGGNLAGAATSLAVMDDWDNGASDGASVSGDVAHDAADAGEPMKQGAKAVTSLHGITLVANNDRTDLYAGVDGVQIVRPHSNLEGIVTGNASNTDGTSTQCIAASGDAAVKQYLTSIILTNTSASNIYVEIKSGTTVMATLPLPANSGCVFNPPVPLKPNAANEAWNFDPSAAATTVYCSMIGFKSKV